jgi:hypothetical protein
MARHARVSPEILSSTRPDGARYLRSDIGVKESPAWRNACPQVPLEGRRMLWQRISGLPRLATRQSSCSPLWSLSVSLRPQQSQRVKHRLERLVNLSEE